MRRRGNVAQKPNAIVAILRTNLIHIVESDLADTIAAGCDAGIRQHDQRQRLSRTCPNISSWLTNGLPNNKSREEFRSSS